MPDIHLMLVRPYRTACEPDKPLMSSNHTSVMVNEVTCPACLNFIREHKDDKSDDSPLQSNGTRTRV